MMKRKGAPREGSGGGPWRLGRAGDVLYAVLVHLGFLAILILSFEWSTTPQPPAAKVDIVQAVVVDESKVQQEVERLKQAEARKQAEQTARERRAREQAQQAEAARKREERRLAAVKKEQEEAKRRLAAERERVEKEKQHAAEVARQKEAEAARLAELQKQKEELQRQKEAEAERLAALKKQQEEAERQRREEEERRKKEEAERQRKEEERRQQLAEQLAAEERRIAAEREARAQSEINRYIEIIKQKVARNWIKPPKWEGFKCTVLVNLMPGGEVLNVTIAQGSGDPIFDTSVERAVRKASPLPLPEDRSLFDHFRELKFVFEPKE